MQRVFVLALLALPLVACGAKVDIPAGGPSSDSGIDSGTSDSGSDDSGATDTGGSTDGGSRCDLPGSCGAPPPAPGTLCWDGSTSGFTGRCIDLGGRCGWEVRFCPPPKACNDTVTCGAPTLYCDRTTCGGSGTCALKPTGCSKEYAPVCGCNYVTYGNACEAQRAGQTIMMNGPCEMPPPPTSSCGGFGGDSCSSTEWCDYPPSDACGGADGTGTCEPRPSTCPLVYVPVCGCDGKTHGNECEAHLNGVSVAYDGACK